MEYRRKANIVLGCVFLIFLIAALLRHTYPELPGLRFFLFVSEAALVGGLADWFAVTALFRKPLGWPYHTALIPRNREKMIEAIGAMVQNELLSENLLRQRIQNFNLSNWLLNKVENLGGGAFLAEKASIFLTNKLTKELLRPTGLSSEECYEELNKELNKELNGELNGELNDELNDESHENSHEISHEKTVEGLTEVLFEGLTGSSNANLVKFAAFLESAIKHKFQDTGLAKPLLSQMRSLVKNQQLDPFLHQGLAKGIEYAATPQTKEMIAEILKQIQNKQLGGGGKIQKTILGIFHFVDTINLDEAAEALQTELILHLQELHAPHHPIRGQLQELVLEQLQTWEKDPEVLNTLENWKDTLLSESALQPLLEEYLREIAVSLEKGILPSQQSLTEFLTPLFEAALARIKEDTQLQMQVDQFCQELLILALQKEHGVIGQIVRETLQGLSDEELNRFIEDKAGNDLQWIRINGCLIGGIAGALLFILLNYAYTPFLKWLGIG